MGIEKITEYSLAGFIGSSEFYTHMIPSVLLTEGCHYLSENGAGWLIDVIASYQTKKFRDENMFQTWHLSIGPENEAVLHCEDGNGNIITSQDIGETDFPIYDFELFCCNNGNGVTIMLKSEY